MSWRQKLSKIIGVMQNTYATWMAPLPRNRRKASGTPLPTLRHRHAWLHGYIDRMPDRTQDSSQTWWNYGDTSLASPAPLSLTRGQARVPIISRLLQKTWPRVKSQKCCRLREGLWHSRMQLEVVSWHSACDRTLDEIAGPRNINLKTCKHNVSLHVFRHSGMGNH